MTLRTVTQTIRRDKWTDLVLDCGHRRSIGGHEFRSATMAGDAALCRTYDCQDGHCYNSNQPRD